MYNNYNNGSYSRAPYRNNFQYGNRGNYRPSFQQGNFQQRKKRTGAKFGFKLGEASRPYIRGWRVSRRFGLITYMCGTNKKTSRVTSKSGKEWENWTCVIQFADSNQRITSCLHNVQAKKVVIPELGIVINPNAPNGGYCGKFTKRK